ncbi:MAG TPA: phage portal protein [Miltoncostaeaceae bacterium]|nr:phage portal protein [Miltoncostaeaceae bacterium]
MERSTPPLGVGIAGAPGAAGPHQRSEDAARLARHAQARRFYDGDQWERKRRPGERRVVVNYARTMVRKVVSYVFGAPVSFVVPQDDGARAQAVEKALAALLAELGADELDFALGVESAKIGDAALKVTWDPDARRPRLTAVDAATACGRNTSCPAGRSPATGRASAPT